VCAVDVGAADAQRWAAREADDAMPLGFPGICVKMPHGALLKEGKL
jgi:hypothetical protein